MGQSCIARIYQYDQNKSLKNQEKSNPVEYTHTHTHKRIGRFGNGG